MNDLEAMGFPIATLQVDPSHDTGLVEVTIEGDEPSYRIIENVAWDHLVWKPELADLAKQADAVCYGTLAQRGWQTRGIINRFLDATRQDCIRFFDVNLRQKAPDRSMIERGLQSATVLKLNVDELDQLAIVMGWTERGEKAAGRLLDDFDLSSVVQTLGASGCRVFASGTVGESVANPVVVADTVGAGDAFGAAFCVALLNGCGSERASRLANQVGGYVASRSGGMPELPPEMVRLFGAKESR
jgi:fructokinase